MITRTARLALVLFATSIAMLVPASPAFADVPSGLTLGASLGVVVIIGVVGLVVLVGIGVLLVRVIMRPKRRADADASGPPAGTPQP